MKARSAKGRQLTRKGHATRERIVASAARLIQEQGIAGTTTEAVRDAAGVSSSQFYHYFKDKMALVRAVIAYQADTVIGAQAEFLGHLDSMRALRRWRNLLLKIQRGVRCEGGCPLGSLSSEIAEIRPEFRVDLDAAFRRWEDGIRSGLRSMYQRGDLREEADPDRLATALLAAVQGGYLLTQIRRNTKPLESAVDAVLDHIESLTTPLQQGRRSARSLRRAS
jgi:AcrR family transcriptional regulator